MVPAPKGVHVLEKETENKSDVMVLQADRDKCRVHLNQMERKCAIKTCTEYNHLVLIALP